MLKENLFVEGFMHAFRSTLLPILPCRSVRSSVIASRLSTAHSLINPADTFNNPLVETLGRAHGGLDGQ
jgi:hypothetical protein